MAHLGNGVEYGLHCLLWLTGSHAEPASSRDLADLQGISASFVAKLFPRLEKAGLVEATGGVRGGYRLARPADCISVLDVVDAIEGSKPLFECQEIRGRCAVFGGKPPAWSIDGVCGVHAVMLRAEQAMRRELARTTIADLAASTGKKAPDGFTQDIRSWFNARWSARTDTKAPTDSDRTAGRRRRKT
ncbi:RrF2 family transcriptional regulator [Dyella telluris]|uniref:Rrf2 family transcriptional regulator n=1 Tax=Dyella telluris TaxID=2763498 RepID=A0A7G8Q3F9_9GAMM|nr:Rrf2 family transcriptional regulator [Dyella telluris]QNK01317.1 Rrf2 family transcriptional regulator [Dyella telluris]